VKPRFDFDERPFIAIWETTQACDLACVHCRACAQPVRSALELSTDEAKRLSTKWPHSGLLSLS
jgi:AdoMet-dependent heme synthase